MLILFLTRKSSLSAYCPSSNNNQCAVLLQNFKNPEETREQEEVWSSQQP